MIPTLRRLGVVISVAIVVLVASQLTAAPKFSAWTAATNVGPTINSPFDDFGPAISKNGLSLYFTSNRPDGFGGTDIWVSQRSTENDEWAPPVNLGEAINTASAEGPPALSRDGHWMFSNSDRPGGFGDQDIWVSWRAHTHDDFGWEPPFNIGGGVNSAFFDAGPSMFENDDANAPLLLFVSNRPGGPGSFDVYVSELAPDGVFGPAMLVPEISSAALEQRSSVRFDGLEFFFHSNRPGSAGNDLWVSIRNSVEDAWSTPGNLGANVNSASADQQPYIAADRKTLFFASNRPGGSGGFDLYVTTREKNAP